MPLRYNLASAMTRSRPYGEQFFCDHAPSSRRSAQVVVPLVMEVLQPGSVVDVGCGTGAWLSEFARGGAHEIYGLDQNTPTSLLEIPSDSFERVDLGRSFSLHRSFDLAVSLEVAEHLPSSSAGPFVSSLVDLAPQVLFSAAVPFQGGWSHVNEQWQEYWRELFRERGFEAVDFIRSRIWANPDVEAYYCQNMVLYVSEDRLADLPTLGLSAVPRETSLDVVHPGLWLANQDPSVLSLKETLVRARRVGTHWLRRRLHHLSE